MLRGRRPRLCGVGGEPPGGALLLAAQLSPLVTRPNPSPMRAEVCRASSEGLTSSRVLRRAPSWPPLPTQELLQKVSLAGWAGKGWGAPASPQTWAQPWRLGVMGRGGRKVRHLSQEVSSVVSRASSNPTCYH